jgi:hypothetical protein
MRVAWKTTASKILAQVSAGARPGRNAGRQDCELFGRCLPEPSSMQTRAEMIEQRVRENNAHASYLDIRRQLFAAVQIGYGASN